MSRVVHLHIGAPKTGTTYLQDRLSRNAAQLAEQGVLFPNRNRLTDSALFQFRAALDLLGQDWGGPPGHAEGAWPAMVRKVRRHEGAAIISHEILAPAPADKVARVMNDLAGAEVHLVYSVRDLARQIPAAWQESVKQGRQWRYDRFLEKAVRGETFFMRAFDLPTVLNRWSRNLPPERVHVVTVPPSGAAPDELWLRFCRALSLDPAWAPLDSERSNESLGVAETEVIRRLNRRIDRTARRETEFDDLVWKLINSGRLNRRRSRKVELPLEHFEWVEEQTQRWLDWLKGSGMEVIGDLEDLRPIRPTEDTQEHATRKDLAAAAIDALAAMTEYAAARPDPEQELTARLRTQAERLRRR